jgi:hypothetical protein
MFTLFADAAHPTHLVILHAFGWPIAGLLVTIGLIWFGFWWVRRVKARPPRSDSELT